MECRKLNIIALLGIFVVLCMDAMAVPRVRAVTMHQGNGSLPSSNSVARLNWLIENPDATAERLILKLTSDGSGSPEIYSREIRLPAKSSVTGVAHLHIGEVGKYKLECFHKGKIIYKDNLQLSLRSNYNLGIGVLNDNYNVSGYSKVQKMTELPYRVSFTFFKAAVVPEHWGHFGNLSMLVLLGAELEKYSNSQLNAIADFVAMGGTLLVAMPETALSMKGTVLEQLLPFNPVGLRKRETYSALASLFGVKPWNEPSAFNDEGFADSSSVNTLLNVLPIERCRPILRQGGASYAYTRYFGRGKVIACTFNPFELCAKDERFALPVWKFITLNSGYVPSSMILNDTDKVNGTLQMLHGYSIPSATYVGMLLLVYVVAVLCIMSFAFFRRLYVLGWFLSCAVGMVMTVFIMIRSSGIADSKSVLSTANVSVSAWNGGRGASMNNSLILSSKDLEVKTPVSSEHVFIRPQETRGGVFKKGGSAQMGCWIMEAGQTVQLEKLSMQKMRPRSLLWLSSMENRLHPVHETPLLEVSPDGLRLRDWKLPDELKGCRALFVSKNEARILEVSNGVVHDPGKSQHLEADTVLLSVAEYVATLPHKGPFLALLRPNPPNKACQFSPTPKNGESSRIYDYEIAFMQAEIAIDEVPDVISPDMLSILIPSHSPMRSYWVDGKWNKVPTNNMPNIDLPLSLQVPLEYAVESPEKIDLDFSVLVPGQDISFDPCIITCDGKPLNYSSRKGSIYTFQTGGAKVVSRLGGNVDLRIKVTRKVSIQNVGAARANYWKIMKLSATVVNKKQI